VNETSRSDMEAEDGAPAERLHPLAVLSGFGKAVRQLAGALFAGGFVAIQGNVAVGLAMIAGLVALILLGLLLHWLRFSFRVGADALRVDSGILSRNHRTIPFDRVADVSIEQGPVQRLFGVARVTLETGGGSVLGSEDGVLAAIRLPRAQALREHVRARRRAGDPAGAVAGPMEEEEAEPPPLFAMDHTRVLIAGLFNFSLALFAGLFGISQTLGDAFKVDPFERDFWRPLLVESGISDYFLEHRLGFAIGGLLVLVAAGLVTGIVRTLLREWNFRLTQAGRGLRRRRGLLTRTDVTLPLRRVQAGVIDTGPVRERFGFHALKVKSLAGERGEPGQMAGDHVLAPLARWDEMEPIAATLRWRLPEETTVWRPVSRAHLWTFLSVLGPFILLLAGAAAAGLLMLPDMTAQEVARSSLTTAERDSGGLVLIGLLCVSFFSFLAALRWLEWKRTVYALEQDRLLIRTGWWNRQTLLLPLRNVQSVDLQETALTRSFGVAHVVIGIAGGSWAGHRVPSLPRKEASLLRRELLTHQP
jgi:putative membrane protein